MTIMDVAKLWEANKHSCWDLCDEYGKVLSTMTLQEFFDEDLDDLPYGSDASVQAHIDTINYWEGELNPFLGHEEAIPEAWAMEVDGDYVEDGNHRLVAAMLVGLKRYPVIVLQ